MLWLYVIHNTQLQLPLTINIDAYLLYLHNARINLTHIAPTIRFLNLFNPQLPSAQIIMSNRYPVVVGNNSSVKA